jgi:hypothetical protein
MFRGFLTIVAASAALAVAAPADAQSQALLDCAAGSLSSSFRSTFADAAMRGATTDEMNRQLGGAVNACAERHSLPRSQWPAYFQYAMTRIERDVFAARLGAANIPVQVIDDAMGFGPGRANPVIEGRLSGGQIDTIYGALRRAGVDVTAVSGEGWGLVGVYTQASSTMWNALRNLR